jgi:2'-5' RNA ligase
VRLFAAVDPPPDEVAAFAAVLGSQDTRLRYVPPEQWHLTTAFYGEVPERHVDELTDRLGRATAKSPALTLQLSGVGTFPRQAARAKVLWAGVTGDTDDLSRLADRCIAAGRRIGLAMEDRAYRPHFTIARARRDTVDLRATVDAMSAYVGGLFTVTTLRLVKSTLGSQVVHETLADLPLGSHQA